MPTPYSEPPPCPRCGLRHSLYRCPPGAAPIARETETPAPRVSELAPAPVEPPPSPKPPFDRQAYQRAYMAPYMRAYRARRKAEKEAAQQNKAGE